MIWVGILSNPEIISNAFRKALTLCGEIKHSLGGQSRHSMQPRNILKCLRGLLPHCDKAVRSMWHIVRLHSVENDTSFVAHLTPDRLLFMFF